MATQEDMASRKRAFQRLVSQVVAKRWIEKWKRLAIESQDAQRANRPSVAALREADFAAATGLKEERKG